MGDLVRWDWKGAWEAMDGAEALVRPSKMFDADRTYLYNNYQIEQTTNMIQTITENISRKRAEIGGLRAGIEAEDFTEDDVSSDIDRLNNDIKTLQDNLEQQQKDLKQFEDDVSVLEAALNEATDEYEKVKGDEDALKTWIESNQ